MSGLRLQACATLLGLGLLAVPGSPGQGAEGHTLASLVDAALANNDELAAAEHARQAAHDNADVQLAPLLPSIGVNGRVGRERVRRRGFAPPEGDETTRTYGIDLQQRLYSPSAYYNHQSSLEGAHAADATFDTQRDRIALRVGLAFLDWQDANERRDVLRKREGVVAAQLATSRNLLGEGAAERPDVNRVEARLRTVRSQIRTESGRVDAAVGSLRQLTGIERIGRLPRLGEGRSLPGPGQLEPWIESAVRRNPELLAASRRVEEARLATRSADSAHLPQLGLVVSKDWDGDSRDLFYGVQVGIPLVSGGGVAARARQAWSLYEGARSQLRATRSRIVEDVRVHHAAAITHRENTAAAGANVALLQDNLNLVAESWQNGLKTVNDVLIAEEELFEALVEWRTEHHEYYRAMLRLHTEAGIMDEKTLGEISERFNI